MSAGVTLIAAAGKVAVMVPGGVATMDPWQATILAAELTRFDLMAEALRPRIGHRVGPSATGERP